MGFYAHAQRTLRGLGYRPFASTYPDLLGKICGVDLKLPAQVIMENLNGVRTSTPRTTTPGTTTPGTTTPGTTALAATIPRTTTP